MLSRVESGRTRETDSRAWTDDTGARPGVLVPQQPRTRSCEETKVSGPLSTRSFKVSLPSVWGLRLRLSGVSPRGLSAYTSGSFTSSGGPSGSPLGSPPVLVSLTPVKTRRRNVESLGRGTGTTRRRRDERGSLTRVIGRTSKYTRPWVTGNLLIYFVRESSISNW